MNRQAVRDWRDDRVGAAERGENPTVLLRMGSGWAVIGDTQHLPGYCLLLHAGMANHLTDLSRIERVAFLTDMTLLGEAVIDVCSAADPEFSRVNYEVLGNSWPHLHAHVHARYKWEPESLRHGPVWRYGEQRHAESAMLSTRHDSLRRALTDRLADLVNIDE